MFTHDVIDTDVHELVCVPPVASARDDLEFGEMLFDRFRNLERRFHVRQHEYQHFCVFGARGAQDVQAGCVAEVYAVAEATHGIDLLRIEIERRIAAVDGVQRPADNLADPPEPGNDDGRMFVLGYVVLVARLLVRLTVDDKIQERRQEHRERHRQYQLVNE